MYTTGLLTTPLSILWMTQVMLGTHRAGKTYRGLPSRGNGVLLMLLSLALFGGGLWLEWRGSIPPELFGKPMAGWIETPELLALIRLILNPLISLGLAWTVSNANDLMHTHQLEGEGRLVPVDGLEAVMQRGRKGGRAYYARYRYLGEWHGQQQIFHAQYRRLTAALKSGGSQQAARNYVVLVLPGLEWVHRLLETESLGAGQQARYLSMLLSEEGRDAVRGDVRDTDTGNG
ncbi:MAG: hypothetical protein HPY85_09970 [Anaerolineae bacterium]|nr:hypothetical protein [Anaerolineae bacterium]